jgi:hypothetical protein
VTRLGEFSPIGRFFSCAVVLVNCESSSIVWATLFLEKLYVLILTNRGLGYILGQSYRKLIRSLGFLCVLLLLDLLKKAREEYCAFYFPFNGAITSNWLCQRLLATKSKTSAIKQCD